MFTYNRTPPTMTFASMAITTILVAPAFEESLPVFFGAAVESLVYQFRHVHRLVIVARGRDGWAVGWHHVCNDFRLYARTELHDNNKMRKEAMLGLQKEDGMR
jgi:hypothetical protein